MRQARLTDSRQMARMCGPSGENGVAFQGDSVGEYVCWCALGCRGIEAQAFVT